MSDAPNSEDRVSCIAGDADAGQRADVVLGRQVAGLSRRRARSLARAGKLRIDGRRAAPSQRVEPGQRLELDLDHRGSAGDFDAAHLEVLAQTERFIYVAKPAGVHTVALTPAQPGVLATAVAERFPECAGASPDPREGGAVHRLDRPTSGVVAFARSREVWEQARQGFSEERVVKHYLAVSRASADSQLAEAGHWPPSLPPGGLQGWIELAPDAMPEQPPVPLAPVPELLDLRSLPPVRVRAPLGRHEHPKLCAVRLDGRRARTLVRPLARVGPHLLLRLSLETGRRHQARVHLSWISLPILGDHSYAPQASPGSSVAPSRAIHLHAFALDLSGVFPDERGVIAPMPADFWPPR